MNNIHFPLFPPLLTLCPSSTQTISLIFPSTVSSVCSLIDRTEIKINICTIPTPHPLVSIRSSFWHSALTKPPSCHPFLEQVRSGWVSSAELLKWGMRHEEGENCSSRRASALNSSLVILITALFCVFTFFFFIFYGGLTGNCAAVIQDQGKRERERRYSIAVTNCKLAIDFPSMWLRHKAHVQTHNSLWRPNTLVLFYILKSTSVWIIFNCKSRISCEHCKSSHLSRSDGAIFQSFSIKLKAKLLHDTTTWTYLQNFRQILEEMELHHRL